MMKDAKDESLRARHAIDLEAKKKKKKIETTTVHRYLTLITIEQVLKDEDCTC